MFGFFADDFPSILDLSELKVVECLMIPGKPTRLWLC
jgi:hypothetical protein